jgi:hypothetical protein
VWGDLLGRFCKVETGGLYRIEVKTSTCDQLSLGCSYFEFTCKGYLVIVGITYQNRRKLSALEI